MQKRLTTAVVVTLAALCASGAAVAAPRAASGPKVRHVAVLGAWAGPDERSFRAVLDDWEAAVPDSSATYESGGPDLEAALRRAIAAGKSPDVAVVPSPLVMRRLAGRKSLRPLVFARKTIARNYAATWLTAATVHATLYGVVFGASNKSTVWYDVPSFRNADVRPPATFAELISAARALRSSGTRAYSIAGADGWTLTDLFENVYLRQAGPRRYDLLAEHKLKWTDASVKAALRTTARIVGDRSNIAGGAAGALETDFAASVSQVFSDTPSKASMVFEGDFVQPLITAATDAQPGTDFDVFTFPRIGKSGRWIVGGTDASIVVLLRSTPASRSLVGFLAGARAASVWVKRGGLSSPNRRVGAKLYPDTIRQRTATALARAQVFRWDLSDVQPDGFAAAADEAFQNFLRNPKNVNGTAAALERAAVRAYKK